MSPHRSQSLRNASCISSSASCRFPVTKYRALKRRSCSSSKKSSKRARASTRSEGNLTTSPSAARMLHGCVRAVGRCRDALHYAQPAEVLHEIAHYVGVGRDVDHGRRSLLGGPQGALERRPKLL